MLNKKNAREKGKVRLSKYFKSYKEGDRVAVKRETSQRYSFPKRIQGLTGVIESKRGRSYIVKIMDGNKEKRFIIPPIHLNSIR